MQPIISVIMPNYNTPLNYLQRAVSSILMQTFSDFEFIIIDDCSTDESYRYLCSLRDIRVKLLRNEQNLGVTASLNVGLRNASGIYVARMDSDDISHPRRLERQLEFMSANPDVIVCGTFAQEIGDAHALRQRQMPDEKTYQCSVLFGNVYGLVHPTAFFRASELRKNHIYYDENIKTAQDYAMWATCSRYGRIANLEEVLFQYRIHEKQVSIFKKELQKSCTMYTMRKQLEKLMPDITDIEIEKHFAFCQARFVNTEMKEWFAKILQANQKTGFVDQDALVSFIGSFLLGKVESAAATMRSPSQCFSLLQVCDANEKKLVLRTLAKRLIRRTQFK